MEHALQCTLEKRNWYLCDPAKNSDCKKRTCLYNPEAIWRCCYRTSTKDFAQTRNGRPIELKWNKAGQYREKFRRLFYSIRYTLLHSDNCF